MDMVAILVMRPNFCSPIEPPLSSIGPLVSQDCVWFDSLRPSQQFLEMVSEMFENVDGRMTDKRQSLVYY